MPKTAHPPFTIHFHFSLRLGSEHQRGSLGHRSPAHVLVHRHARLRVTKLVGHLSEDTARVASDAMTAAIEQVFETTAAAAGDHTATTAAAGAATQADPTGAPAVQHGGPRGDRTHNPRIKSPLLCQLS